MGPGVLLELGCGCGAGFGWGFMWSWVVVMGVGLQTPGGLSSCSSTLFKVCRGAMFFFLPTIAVCLCDAVGTAQELLFFNSRSTSLSVKDVALMSLMPTTHPSVAS